jgi:hypothetical protein
MLIAKCSVAGVVIVAVYQGAVRADGLKINDLSASDFSNQNLCAAAGGAGVAPTFTELPHRRDQ